MIFLAFSVILVTLIGQGLTLPSLIRGLGVVDDGSLEHEELHAREVATDAALLRIEELRDGGARPPAAARPAQGVATSTAASTTSTTTPERTASTARSSSRPRRSRSWSTTRSGDRSSRAERLAVLELRDRGEISDDALRSIERDLDLDELRREA